MRIGAALLVAFCALAGAQAHATPGTLARMLIEHASITGVAVSPDARFAVFRVDRPDIDSNSIKATWHLVSLDSGTTRAVADAGNPVWGPFGDNDAEVPVWAPDSRAFFYRKLLGEELAVWRTLVDGTTTQITREDANVLAFAASASRQSLVFVLDAPRAQIKAAEARESTAGIVLDGGMFLYEAPYHQNHWLFGRATTLRIEPGGAFRGLAHLLGAQARRLIAYDFASGSTRTATSTENAEHANLLARDFPIDPGVAHVVAAQGGARRAFLLRENRRDEFGNVIAPWRLGWSHGTADADRELCAHPLCADVRPKPAWRPGSNEIIFVTQSKDGESSLVAWDVARGSVRRIVALLGVLGGGNGALRHQSSGCPVTAGFAWCAMASSKSPPSLVRIDLQTGAIKTVFDPNLQLRQQALAKVEPLTWKDKWGRAFRGVLVYPAGAAATAKFPLVITSYQCDGFLQGGGGRYVPEYALAAAGIGALCVHWTTGMRELPNPAPDVPPGIATRLQTLLDAWESGVHLLVDRGLVDERRVGVSGWSFSAQGVHYAIMRSRMFSVAAAGHMTLLDPFAYYFGTFELGSRAADLRNGYGLPHPAEDPGHIYERVSSALNAARIDAAVLVQTADGEFRPGAQYYLEMARRRKAMEVIVYPGEEHTIWQPAHRWTLVNRFVDWLRFWLQGYEDPSPENAAQYLRWRNLRDADRADRTR
jgi:dipeptidyl aminopeptidase/acylaminoacyl peptidase